MKIWLKCVEGSLPVKDRPKVVITRGGGICPPRAEGKGRLKDYPPFPLSAADVLCKLVLIAVQEPIDI